MIDILKLRPTKLQNCLLHKSCIDELLSCNFINSNILLRGRAGVGKTLICNIVKTKYPMVNIIENVNLFKLKKPTISTSNNLNLFSLSFDKIIDIVPLSKLELLKQLSFLIGQNKPIKNNLYESINLYYPNINKILNHYLYEN